MVTIMFIVLVVLMLIRNGGIGFLPVAIVWLAAGVFNPNVDSGLIWVIGFGLGYLLDPSE